MDIRGQDPTVISFDSGNGSLLFDENATASETPVSEDYCGPLITSVGMTYGNIHGFTSLILCICGSFLNMLNLIVLTRRGMISPTNVILTGLALADLLNMAEYIPFALFFRVLKSTGYPPMTYGWAVFVLFHSNFSQVCHTGSIWLTVTLAVWRYIMVSMPLRNKSYCTMERAKLAVGIAYGFSLILCIPVYLTFSINITYPKSKATPPPKTWTSTFSAPLNVSGTEGNSQEPPEISSQKQSPSFVVNYSALASTNNQLLAQSNFWIYSVVIKIIPCIVLTVVSLRLVNSLMEAKRCKETLMSTKRSSGSRGEEASGSDRTTRMLLAVLLLFLITEFPQGILGLLSGFLGKSFFQSCYLPLGDLMDFVALLNSAINFILYCSMSKKFRDTFVQVFHLRETCLKPLFVNNSTSQ